MKSYKQIAKEYLKENLPFEYKQEIDEYVESVILDFASYLDKQRGLKEKLPQEGFCMGCSRYFVDINKHFREGNHSGIIKSKLSQEEE